MTTNNNIKAAQELPENEQDIKCLEVGVIKRKDSPMPQHPVRIIKFSNYTN